MDFRDSKLLYARPVLALLLSLIAGVVVGTGFPDRRIWAYLFIFLCVLLIFFRICQGNAAFVSPFILFIGLGYLSIQPWMSPKFPSHHIIHFTDTHAYKITGVVDTTVVQYLNRQKFILRTQALEGNKTSIPVTGKIRMTVSGKGPGLSKGDRICFFGKIKSIRNFNNPGGFDYRRYMAFKTVWATAYAPAQKIKLLGRDSENRLGMTIEDARAKISDLIDRTGTGKPQGILKALIVGERYAIDQDTREAFNRVGIGHLLAISGLHIGIVATVSFLFFRWILSHIHLFLRNAWTKKGAVVLSVFPVLIYGLLSGMSPSTQRAVIMVMVFLMAFLFEREHDSMNTLALAAMVILVVHPPSLFSISFQLSFTAVLAIIYGLSKVKNPWLSTDPGKKPAIRLKIESKLFYFFMASGLAILGTLPLVMFYFNQISLVGLMMNFIIVPLIGFVVVPLGLLAVFLYPLTLNGALICLKIGAGVLSKALFVIHFFSDFSFAAIKTVTPSPFEIFCYYVLFVAILNLKRVPSKEPAGRDKVSTLNINPSNRHFIYKPALIIAFLVSLAIGVDASYWLYQRFWRDDFRVTMIDVGHGNAALLELPKGYNMLIDGGGFSDNRVFDVGARIIAPFLWQKKINTIDTLVLSHANSDHLNGLIYIAEHFHVKRVWTNHETADTFGYKRFMEVIQNNEIQTPGYQEIAGFHDINGVRIDIMYPPPDFIEKREKERWRTLNNNSLVLKAAFGSESFLFPGDIKSRAEYELVSTTGDKLKSTVLLAPHHGSKTSSTDLFLKKVDPEVVVISSGWKSRFGFPHPSVLKRYQTMGCRILGTAHNGAISIETDGQKLSISPTITDTKPYIYKLPGKVDNKFK